MDFLDTWNETVAAPKAMLFEICFYDQMSYINQGPLKSLLFLFNILRTNK